LECAFLSSSSRSRGHCAENLLCIQDKGRRTGTAERAWNGERRGRNNSGPNAGRSITSIVNGQTSPTSHKQTLPPFYDAAPYFIFHVPPSLNHLRFLRLSPSILQNPLMAQVKVTKICCSMYLPAISYSSGEAQPHRDPQLEQDMSVRMVFILN
jgi:hypothetical protein